MIGYDASNEVRMSTVQDAHEFIQLIFVQMAHRSEDTLLDWRT